MVGILVGFLSVVVICVIIVCFCLGRRYSKKKKLKELAEKQQQE